MEEMNNHSNEETDMEGRKAHYTETSITEFMMIEYMDLLKWQCKK